MHLSLVSLPVSPLDAVNRPFFSCAACALWRPAREDSISDDSGICPRKCSPHNRTMGTDGCFHAVPSLD